VLDNKVLSFEKNLIYVLQAALKGEL